MCGPRASWKPDHTLSFLVQCALLEGRGQGKEGEIERRKIRFYLSALVLSNCMDFGTSFSLTEPQVVHL